jgi:hypothetical protein
VVRAGKSGVSDDLGPWFLKIVGKDGGKLFSGGATTLGSFCIWGGVTSKRRRLWAARLLGSLGPTAGILAVLLEKSAERSVDSSITSSGAANAGFTAPKAPIRAPTTNRRKQLRFGFAPPIDRNPKFNQTLRNCNTTKILNKGVFFHKNNQLFYLKNIIICQNIIKKI